MIRLGRSRVALVTVALSAAVFAGFGSQSAAAHPLGNFSVNHLNTLTFTPTQIVDEAVIDTAEIPTAQAAGQVDTDGNGSASAAELDAFGKVRCGDLGAAITLTVDGSAVPFAVAASAATYVPGQAGLDTTRLECRFEAAVDLSSARTVQFEDRYLPDRIGWHEINAVGDGSRLVASPVPQTSVTNGLKNYPTDLLSSPLDVRSASFDVQPGAGPSTVSTDAEQGTIISNSGFFSGIVSRVQNTVNDLIGRQDLTLGVGLLAILLALVLGASHAVLPGHGKTVMAAYIAGRQGSVRDAVIVGATVTGTHTGGVLLLGTALTVSTSLAGESVLGYLGVTSGGLIALLGAALLIAAIRHRNTGMFGHGHTHGYDLSHSHSHGGHSHSHDGHDHSHGHEGGHAEHAHAATAAEVRTHDAVPQLLGGSAGRGTLVRSAVVGRSSVAAIPIDHTLTLEHAFEKGNGHSLADGHDADGHDADGHDSHGHDAHSHDHDSHDGPRTVSRRGLVGMGIAGGLVPSPSALIILLSAIALGRTWFGILLVLAYGLGMAATLTAAGVMLVSLRDRYQRRAGSRDGRIARTARRWGKVAPYLTGGLVLVVGLGLAIRSIGQI